MMWLKKDSRKIRKEKHVFRLKNNNKDEKVIYPKIKYLQLIHFNEARLTL